MSAATPEMLVYVDLFDTLRLCDISVTPMSELQAPVDPDCADCEGVMEIVVQIWITAL